MLVRPANLLFGAKQEDVRQTGLHRIANASGAIRSRDAFGARVDGRHGIALDDRRLASLKVAQMGRIDSQVSGEGFAQCLLGRDQGAKALVDLTVRAFAALLDCEHHQQSNADADKREKRQADKRHEHALPRAEVDVAQSVGALPVASSPVSSPAGYTAIPAPKWPSSNLRQSAMTAAAPG
ncbi:hypothetical protein MESS2_1360006 [Mesorhizobium metallidurans STM 2683]|uniref:Uncharacterized protein n=1 Tax=Mesorhizobium metallidurans STM 2683 TaxID=1297569 RepID=M5EYP9_9HYPH|nr:hypothetical protein [Mesorhizobium metallidurans]CCV04701.1 hypothetical protein MESS2_1360006 [Mesorhizobium metallidurans STM 2683]